MCIRDSASTEEEIRVDVNELAPPVISLVTPSIGLKVVAGREYILTPDVYKRQVLRFGASKDSDLRDAERRRAVCRI